MSAQRTFVASSYFFIPTCHSCSTHKKNKNKTKHCIISYVNRPVMSPFYPKLYAHNKLDLVRAIMTFDTGPFLELNAEVVTEEVDTMFRTMYKLSRSFSDQPGPQRISNNVKGKIDKFKAHLPLLGIICNPGIRGRHWTRVSRFDLIWLDLIRFYFYICNKFIASLWRTCFYLLEALFYFILFELHNSHVLTKYTEYD